MLRPNKSLGGIFCRWSSSSAIDQQQAQTVLTQRKREEAQQHQQRLAATSRKHGKGKRGKSRQASQAAKPTPIEPVIDDAPGIPIASHIVFGIVLLRTWFVDERLATLVR